MQSLYLENPLNVFYCYNQSFTFSYKIVCKLEGAKKPKCLLFKNEDILQILCTTEKWLNLWQVCRQQMQECTIHKRLAFYFQFNSKFAIYNKKDLTMQFMSLHTMLTGECCDSERFANDIALGHDDEYFQISDCQNKVGKSCSFVHALIVRKWALQDFWHFMCDFILRTWNFWPNFSSR